MGSITAPRPSYVPKLPAGVVDKRVLSDAQLETLIYAGDAFERDISGLFKAAEEGLSLAPDQDGRPYRTGFFLGDGTGAGKGRQVAAIILDQWLRGRRKHIWISKTETLLEDARRDWTAVGGLALDIQHLNQWKLGSAVGAAEGVLFLTYATLRSNRGNKGTRLRSEEHTSELQSLMRISYAVFCLKKKKNIKQLHYTQKNQLHETKKQEN